MANSVEWMANLGILAGQTEPLDTKSTRKREREREREREHAC